MGDINTTFFHKYALQRRRTIRIWDLQSADGNMVSDEIEIECGVRDYFQALFSFRGSHVTENVLNGVVKTIAQEDNAMLTKAYTKRK